MTKSSTNIDFACALTAILKDVRTAYPDDQVEWSRDSKRITQQSRHRGLPFFTIELPEIGKRLDRSLSSMRLVLDNIPHTRGRNPNSVIPRLFQGLWIRIFDDDGLLRSDADPNAVLFLRQLLYVAKKVELECSPKFLYETTKEFFRVEENIPLLPALWTQSGDISRSDCGDLLDSRHHYGTRQLDLFAGSEMESSIPLSLLRTCQLVTDRVVSSFGFFSPELAIPRHGPGAVSDTSREMKSSFPTWSETLEEVFPFDEFGLLNPSWYDYRVSDEVKVVDHHSKLCDVPKSQKGPRLIASEPACNQWIQQGVANWLRDSSRHTIIGIMVDFFDQDPSRTAALEASRTGLRATIDLKSASDRMTCWLVQRMFRSNLSLLRAFRACRTKVMYNPIDVKFPTHILLRKYATQGSALTFPLQSIIFSLLALGTGKFLEPERGLKDLAKEVRVFGDDIIVPSTWVVSLTSLLESLGLRVNAVKSHSEGNFRESCGMDAFRGHDVTPAYITSPDLRAQDTRSLQGVVDVQNNFYLKGFWHTAHFLIRTARLENKFPIVELGARVSGLLTLQKKGSNHDNSERKPLYLEGTQERRGRFSRAVRFNRNLQRVEYFVPFLRDRVSTGHDDLYGLFKLLSSMEYRSRRNLRYEPYEEYTSPFQRRGNLSEGTIEEISENDADLRGDPRDGGARTSNRFRLSHLYGSSSGSLSKLRKVAEGLVTYGWAPEEDLYPRSLLGSGGME